MEENTTTNESEEKELHPPKKMTTGEFWIRFSLWTLFAVVVPIGFIAWRFGLFKPTDNTVQTTSLKLSGWGIIGVIIIGIFILAIIRQAKKGLPYGSMLCQCIDGYSLLIPLLLAVLVIDGVKDNIDKFEQILIVTLVSEAVGIPINPMRRWAMEHNIERSSNILTKIIKEAIKK